MLVVAHDRAEPGVHHLLQPLPVAQPDLDEHVRIDAVAMAHEHFFPGDGFPAVLADQRVHSVHEVPVRAALRQVLLRHPLGHVRHLRPAPRVHFIASHMEEFAREQSFLAARAQQIAQQRVQRGERALSTRIQRRLAVFARTQLRIYQKTRSPRLLPTHQDVAWPGTSISATTCTPRARA